MSIYYGLKGSNREYIVVKHQLSGINTEILGIRYVDGYGVVSKNSKEHLRLKQVKMAVAAELPITFLPNVKSVINHKQIKAIWGPDVYRCFLDQMASKSAKPEQMQTAIERPFCKHEKEGKTCGNQSLDGFEHCRAHIADDKRLQPYIKDMKLMPKAEKKKFLDEAIDKAREN